MVFFYPKTIQVKKSAINGEVKVIKFFGSYSLVVGKYTQSGGLVHTIWQKALENGRDKITSDKPEVLILGVGGGSNAKLVAKFFKKAKITGIEIDPVIIELGRKYFSLGKVENLQLVITDAIAWVIKQARQNKRKFDLILVDLYLGSEPAPHSTDDDFLFSINQLLSSDGIAFFNWLIIKEKRTKANILESKLNNFFSGVEKIPTPANTLFSAGKLN